QAMVGELGRRGDHLNWMISDAIILLRDPEKGREESALAEAERKLRCAIALKDDEPGPWTLLGELSYRRSDFPNAIAALGRALSFYEQYHQPPSVRTLAWLARSYHATGERDAARAALQQARAELDHRHSADAAEQEIVAEAARQLDQR